MNHVQLLLKLDDKQHEVLARWIENLPERETEETACMEQHPFNVTTYSTGIGPVIIVWTMINDEEYSVHLGYDDNEEIVR